MATNRWLVDADVVYGGRAGLLADAPSPPAEHNEGIMKLNLFQREHGSSLFLLTLPRVVFIFIHATKYS